MLPTISIDLATICPFAFDVDRGRLPFFGYAFAYYFNEVVAFFQKQGKSLDRVLTELVLEKIITIGQKKCVLSYAFCKLGSFAPPKADLTEDDYAD